MTPQLIPSQKMSTYFFNKNSSDLRCLARTELRVVWRPGGGTESSIFFSWNYWIPLHLSVLSPAEHNMATQCWADIYCGILKFQYFRFKLSILPNFIVNKVLFLILVGGRVGGWTAVSFVSDEPRKSETREGERERDLFILFLVGNGIQQKAKDQSDFTKLI